MDFPATKPCFARIPCAILSPGERKGGGAASLQMSDFRVK